MNRLLQLLIAIVGVYLIVLSAREAWTSHSASYLRKSLCAGNSEFSTAEVLRTFLNEFPEAYVYEGQGNDRSVTILYDTKPSLISPFTSGTVILMGTLTSGDRIKVTDVTYSAQETGRRTKPDKVYLRNQPLP
jgi:hypothetical protein